MRRLWLKELDRAGPPREVAGRSPGAQLLLPLDDLGRQPQIGFAAHAFQIIDQHRLAVGRGFRHPHIARDNGVVDLAAHELAHVGDDLIGQVVARIVHGQHDAVDGEAGIERVAHLLHRLDQLRKSFQGEELALQRHQDGVGGRHRVDGQEIERRRAIHQHIGEGGGVALPGIERAERIAQPEGAVARLADLELEPGEIERRGRDEEARHRGRQDRVAQARPAGQRVIGRLAAAAAIDAEPGRRIALRIEINNQHLLADSRQRGAEIDRRRGLADAALLVGDREHARRPRGRRRGCRHQDIDRLDRGRIRDLHHGIRSARANT